MSSRRTPSLAILGAGPTGLEAALAAIEHSFAFTLYEATANVAGHVRDWSHVELFSPWEYNISPRARRALIAAGIELPASEDPTCPTGRELVERVLAPLATLDGMCSNLRLGTRVVSVGREGLLKHQEIGSDERRSRQFRLLLENRSGHQWIEPATVVLDCTGSYSHPNALGDGGIPAPGESALDNQIHRRIPDLESESDDWAGRTILLVGAGHSAMTAACDLARLAERQPGTSVLWALRRENPSWHIDAADPLPRRSALAARAQELVAGASPAVRALLGVVVESLTRDERGFAVELRWVDESVETVVVDKILSLTGSLGDHSLYRQLQIHECYATLGPMKLAAALAGSASDDCLAQESQGAETLFNPEPDFFILGAKSYGRTPSYLMRLGWQQVDEVLELLQAREAPPIEAGRAN